MTCKTMCRFKISVDINVKISVDINDKRFEMTICMQGMQYTKRFCGQFVSFHFANMPMQCTAFLRAVEKMIIFR